MLISGVVYGVLLRKAVLSRIDAIRGTALAIVEGDLAERLPTGNYSDEFSRLTEAINGMLERIEHLVHGVRNVSNAIAHDLRTPLAELRSRLEDLTRTRPPADLIFSELDEAVADIDRVIESSTRCCAWRRSTAGCAGRDSGRSIRPRCSTTWSSCTAPALSSSRSG